MTIECLKLFLLPNPRNKNIDWRLEIEYRADTPPSTEVTLRRMEKCFKEILKYEKKLAPLPSKHLPINEPILPYHISEYEVDWQSDGIWGEHVLARFIRSYDSNSTVKFGLLRIYSVPSVISPTFFYLLLKVILTYFDTSKPSLSECFLEQDGWDFLFNDIVIRKYFFNDPKLSDEIGDRYGFIQS